LVLLKSGSLVDTTRGETIPEGQAAMPATTAEQVAAHRVLDLQEIAQCVYREGEQSERAGSSLSTGSSGVIESPLIGPENAAEAITAGKMDWSHGFHVRRLDFAPGGALPSHTRAEEEVIFIHQGELQLIWAGGELSLREGDVFTVPIGLAHEYRNLSEQAAQTYFVRGGDAPGEAQWAESTLTV
jgi:quercetin dioxygenase-like cupin family protein